MNLKQQTFITEYLRHNSAYTAYCLAYHVKDQTKYDSIMSAANRLLNDPKVGGIIDAILKGIHHEVEQEIRAELKTDLLTVQRKREILAKIATGEMYAVQVYKGKDCSQCTQHVMPTINQMLKAIDLDNKMAGLYSVDKRQFTVDNKTDQQVDKFIHSVGLIVEEQKESEEPQQTTTNKEETPLLTKEGTITNSEACLLSGEVDSNRTENATESQQNTTNYITPSGIGEEQSTTTELSPAGGGVRRTGGGTLAQGRKHNNCFVIAGPDKLSHGKELRDSA